MSETTLTIKINDDLKSKLETYSSKKGQSILDSVYSILNSNFEQIEEADMDYDDDLFNSFENQTILEKSIKQANEGKLIKLTMKEIKGYAK